MEYSLLWILFLVTFITMNFINKIKSGTYKNPLFFYLFFWVSFVLISIFNPLHLNIINVKTYLLIFISIIFFSIGFIFRVNSVKSSELKMQKIYLNNKVIIFIQIFITLLLIMYLRRYNNLLDSMGVAEARNIKFTSGYLFKSYLENIIYDWGINTAIYLFGMINIYNFIVNKKVNINLFLAIIDIAIYSNIGSGRMIIFDFLCYIFFMIIFDKTNRKNSNNINFIKNLKVRYILIFCGLLVMITDLYAKRIGKDLSIQNFKTLFLDNIEQGILYFTGPFVALDTFFKNSMYEGLLYTFGKCTFLGISEVLGTALTLLGVPYITGSSIVGKITLPPIYIGNNNTFNAFYTSILNFYLDGGIVGIIIFSLLFGTFVAYVYNIYNKNSNPFNLILLSYVTWMSIASMYRLPSTVNVFLIIIFLLILSEKNTKTNS